MPDEPPTRHDIDDAGFLDRFAGVEHLQCGDRVVVLAQQLRGAVEDAPALGAGHGGPDGKTGFGRGDRLVYLGATRLFDVAQLLAGRGIDVLE